MLFWSCILGHTVASIRGSRGKLSKLSHPGYTHSDPDPVKPSSCPLWGEVSPIGPLRTRGGSSTEGGSLRNPLSEILRLIFKRSRQIQAKSGC
ncbi:hypothetical protein BaRGS_00037379 [Batillaria attramentaria]|uniref:Secreted protein n=1 Tax=Batillaria attramentaria TaxID=370345 RepID=A0ABD0J8U8_9CAEN